VKLLPVKLVVFDADKTLWSHPNVSELTLPFKLVNTGVVSDARGETFHLFNGIRDVLTTLQKRNIMITVASWNKPEPVKKALELFNIDRFFRNVKAEFHPSKHLMIERTLLELAGDGVKLKPEEILYVDDRDLHVDKIREKIGAIHFIQMWIDAKKPEEILEYVEKSGEEGDS
jgi:magnesium-dependent phosphatase-1